MRLVHRVTLTAFAKPEEDIETVREGIKALVTFNIEEAKIKIQARNAEGFDQRTIKIFTIILTKESHTNDFLEFLLEKLTEEQKRLLVSQAESRLDQELDFFIRIDKDQWIKERQAWLTDSGNCFHIKLSLAAFPKNRKTAMKLIEKLFPIGNL